MNGSCAYCTDDSRGIDEDGEPTCGEASCEPIVEAVAPVVALDEAGLDLSGTFVEAKARANERFEAAYLDGEAADRAAMTALFLELGYLVRGNKLPRAVDEALVTRRFDDPLPAPPLGPEEWIGVPRIAWVDAVELLEELGELDLETDPCPLCNVEHGQHHDPDCPVSKAPAVAAALAGDHPRGRTS